MNQFLTRHYCRIPVAFLLTAVLCLTILPSFKTSMVMADHGDFELADGVYRIPYSDDTDITVTQDHHTHGGPDGN